MGIVIGLLIGIIGGYVLAKVLQRREEKKRIRDIAKN